MSFQEHKSVNSVRERSILVPWVPEVCLARFPASVNVSIVTRSLVGRRPSAGKSRRGPRETSGTQGTILAVRIAKFGPLKEPIRMLLFTLDQFSQKIEGGFYGI